MRYLTFGAYPDGDGVQHAGGQTDQALLKQLHAWATALYQAHQFVLAAQARGDQDAVQAGLGQARLDLDQFQWYAEAFRANDPSGTQLSGFDQFILTTGQWIEDSVQALPGAIAALPKAIFQGLGSGVILPVVGLVLLAMFLLRQAEGTRTFRKYVA